MKWRLWAVMCLCLSVNAEQLMLERTAPGMAQVPPGAVDACLQTWDAMYQKTDDPLVGSIHGFLLVRHQKVVAEGYYLPFRKEIPHNLFSGTKSFTATAVGFAIQENLLKLDDPVIKFFQKACPKAVSPELAGLTVRDLLTMQSGYTVDLAKPMLDAADPVTGFLSVELKNKPGSKFMYNNGASHLLSVIITKVTGMSEEDYLKPRLFAPLGFGEYSWEKDKSGNSLGGWGLYLTSEDFAKFAVFYLNHGQWNGKQLLNADFCRMATMRQTADLPDNPSYGFQFWIGPGQNYRAAGFLGQFAVVMPEADAVLIVFAGTKLDRKILAPVNDILLPAMLGKSEVPAMTDDALATKLSELKLERFAGSDRGRFAPGAVVELVMDLTDGKKQTVKLTFGKDGCLSQIDDKTQTFGYAKWVKGDIAPEFEKFVRSKSEIWNRAGWLTPDELVLDQLLIDDPYQEVYRLRFDVDTVTVTHQEWYHDEPKLEHGSWRLLKGSENLNALHLNFGEILLEKTQFSADDLKLKSDDKTVDCRLLGGIAEIRRNDDPAKRQTITLAYPCQLKLLPGMRYRLQAELVADQPLTVAAAVQTPDGELLADSNMLERVRSGKAGETISFDFTFVVTKAVDGGLLLPTLMLGNAANGTKVELQKVRLSATKI